MSGPSAIFHLSFPVSDLAASLAFYETRLAAQRGRSGDGWTDVILFGHQLTLHARPEQVLPREAHGVRHFGAILPWAELERLRDRLQADAADLRVLHRDAGGSDEHLKLLLDDPDGNLIELKAYRSPEATLLL
jgi:extradiol dioxygenase family protein